MLSSGEVSLTEALVDDIKAFPAKPPLTAFSHVNFPAGSWQSTAMSAASSTSWNRVFYPIIGGGRWDAKSLKRSNPHQRDTTRSTEPMSRLKNLICTTVFADGTTVLPPIRDTKSCRHTLSKFVSGMSRYPEVALRTPVVCRVAGAS